MFSIQHFCGIVNTTFVFLRILHGEGFLLAFYERFEWLCKEKGVTPTQAARDIGIRQSVVSMWKKRGSTPNGSTLKKMADYFEVTTDYLLGKVTDVKKTGSGTGISFSRPVTQQPIPHTLLEDNPNAIYYSGVVGYMARQEAMRDAFFELNGLGQLKAIECMRELRKIPEYQREHIFVAPQSPQEPQDGTDTTPPENVPDTPPEGE